MAKRKRSQDIHGMVEATAAPTAEERAPEVEAEPSEAGFPIVGIGASAGGLAAFEAFFSAMPADTESGMAFVLVQHLAPDHKSILTDLVKRYTHMQVYEVEDGMTVQPNCAYIIPPNRDMAFLNGTLQLLEPTAVRGMRLPIDFFFRSLAQDQHQRAICIVLSGTGSDGTLGVRAVKGEGGMVMAQTPDSTAYDGMPRSAIATGMVDYVLPPAEMPTQLIAYVAHAFAKRPRPVSIPTPKAGDTLKKICAVLRAQTGHDFSQYKENTLLRRIERRMALHQIERPDEYVRYLQQNPAEAEALSRDLLIGVTSFFRDPEAFAALETQAIPRLFAGKPAGGLVRVWVCACSTGEEAYSIAILIQEHLEALKQTFKVQVFATDADRQAIDQARSGVYPASIAADVSPERLARFFAQDTDGGVYRIQKVIRDLLVFSEQDVIDDPPFSKLDLISCRNLLIYMNADLQKKLIPLFHYALNPQGVLFLGTSETVGEFRTLFTALDRKWKLYLRQEDVPGAARPALGGFVPPLREGQAQPLPLRDEARANLRELAEQALLQHYALAGVLVNGRGEIFHIYGRTGQYLEPAPGDAGLNILPMAREGLQRALTTALHRVVAHKEQVHTPGLRVRTNGAFITVNLTVQPVASGPGGAAMPDLYLVILEEAAPLELTPPGLVAAEGAGVPTADADRRIAALEQELRAKEEYLQTALEEMETANEEFKSTNEEMQSVNEELQSTNEELETSKEELQSVNEELATVNAELQTKVADLTRANNDMNNLLAGTGVGTLFVDLQLRISRFTPAATQVINLIQTDVGRPVGHIVSNLVGYDRLVADVEAVQDSLVPLETEVQTRAGAWYLMRIRPYRTLENAIEGTVITFVDITRQKHTEAALREAQAFADNMVATVREPLLVLDENLKVVSANRAFYSTFQVKRDETLGRVLYELGNRQWDIPALRELLEDILPQNSTFDDLEVTHEFEQIGRRTMLLNARRISGEAGQTKFILLAIEDITGRRSQDL
jgi:two-component system, chemotaxis family, CheB/CheR fusion protein